MRGGAARIHFAINASIKSPRWFLDGYVDIDRAGFFVLASTFE
jgi:hypothetical protein